MATPIKLTIYDPETHESVKELQTSLVPWGILKRAIKLAKSLKGLDLSAVNTMAILEVLDEDAIDELTGLVADIFAGRVTVEELNQGTEILEMGAVLQAIVTRAFGEFENAGKKGNPTQAAARVAKKK